MNIRRATREDSFLLSSLTRDVQSLHAQHHAKIFKTPDADDFAVPFFEEMLSDPAVTIFIAEDRGNAVGDIVCKLVERPENPFTFAARILLVDQISVRPEARRKGIGAALLEQAESLARELEAERIVLDSWDFNLGAHTFFERMGFQKFNFRFWKHL
jgi:GNAT superfamily N-acetyltransferase